VPYRPPPSRKCPAPACAAMYLSIASNRASGGMPPPSSILTNPMNRGIARSSRWWPPLLGDRAARRSNGNGRLRDRRRRIFRTRSARASAVVLELDREVQVLATDEGLHGLQVVARLGGDPQLVALDLRLDRL